MLDKTYKQNLLIKFNKIKFIIKNFITYVFFKFLGLQIVDPCQSINISGVFFMKFNGSLIEVYCEVELEQENKWLVKINFLFNKTLKL